MPIIQRFRSAFQELTKDRRPGGVLYSTMESSSAGVSVTDDAAMRFAAVHACVRVLSEDISSLPLHLYQRNENGGKERLRSHPLYEILHDRPNPEMTAVIFKQAMMVNLLLTGNAYAFIEFDRAGQVMGLWPILSDGVQPYRSESGLIRYRAGKADLASSEVLHIPGMSFDGLLGMSPIGYARESIGLGIAAEQFGSKFFRNGTHLGGIIEDPGVMGNEQFERARSQFSTLFKGLQNSHGVAILEKGAKFHAIGIPPEDAQFLETRKFQRSEIAAIYRVPPHLIGDLERATFSNIEHQDLAYLQRSLLPWLVRIEQAMQTKLLTKDERRRLLIEHDTGSFLRGDTQSRMQAYSTAIQSGIMSPNEARMKENMNPVQGGDVILLPLNMRPADDPDGDPPDKPLDTKRALRSHFAFGGKQRAADNRSNAVVTGRWTLTDTVIKTFEPIFQRILEDQAVAVKAIVDRVYGLRSAAEIASLRELIKGVFLSYYDNPPKFLRDAIASSADLARLNAYAEIRLPDAKGEWYDAFVAKFTRDLSKRINGQSYGELMRLLDKVEAKGGNVPDAVYNKLANWGKAKYARVAETEGTRLSCAIVSEVLVQNGYEIVWASNPSCCDACKKLNGSKISQGDVFVGKGGGFGGLKRHPPLHNGCKCTVKAGKKLDIQAPASSMESSRFDQADARLQDAKWLKAEFPSQAKFDKHIRDHLSAYDSFSRDRYLERARELLSARTGTDVEGFVSYDGWLYKYDHLENDFAIGRPDGKISTLFKPDDGLDYWIERKEEHGLS